MKIIVIQHTHKRRISGIRSIAELNPSSAAAEIRRTIADIMALVDFHRTQTVSPFKVAMLLACMLRGPNYADPST